MPRCGGGVAAAEDGQAAAEPRRELRQAQRLDAGRGKLDRQRHPVEPRHHLPDERSARGVEQEMRVGGAGPVGEQLRRRAIQHWAVRLPDGSLPAGPLPASTSRRAAPCQHWANTGPQRQRQQPVPPLSGERERRPARREYPHVVGGV